MIIPLRTDSRLRSTPWMNWLLIAANVLVYAFQEARPQFVGHYWLAPRDPHLLTYFSYAFLHGSIAHLVGNMLFLYIFGNNVNDKMGPLGYLAFYLGGGVLAGVGHVLAADSPVVGASGAVAAVTGAYLVLFPRSRITVLYFFWLIGTLEIPSMYFIIFFFLQDVIMNFAPDFFGGRTAVAHMAHISGTLFGVAVCMGLLAGRLLPRDQFDLLALVGRWNKRRQYQKMVHQGFDPFGYAISSRTKPASRPDPGQERLLELRAQVAESIAHHKLEEATELYLRLIGMDREQVLSRQNQLDVANQLASEQRYGPAADAYERVLKHYPNAEQIEKVELMLGLIYARYLERPERARELLTRCVQRLHSGREAELAQAELNRLNSGTDESAGLR